MDGKFTDYFALLEVDRSTSKEGIKKAFMAKALIFHPDKAKTPAEKKVYTKTYEDLQNAYRILSSDVSRKQYLDANQKTNIDLKREARNVTYSHAPVKTDFHDAFKSTRDKKDKEQFELLEKQVRSNVVSQREVRNFIEQRNKDTYAISKGDQGREANASETNQGRVDGPSAVQVYEEPIGYSSGLEERSNVQLSNVSFEGVPMNKLITGNDISGTGNFNTKEFCPMPLGAMENKIKLIQMERENFKKLSQMDFKTVPTEVEVAYSELFKTK
jgi:curved DNA-binding protein CbpA